MSGKKKGAEPYPTTVEVAMDRASFAQIARAARSQKLPVDQFCFHASHSIAVEIIEELDAQQRNKTILKTGKPKRRRARRTK